MILFQARVTEPGIETVHLKYVAAEGDRPNWDRIAYGSADHQAALEIVKVAVFLNRLHWIIVPDGDPRDEQKVGTPAQRVKRL